MASVRDLSPDHFRRRFTRPVSYYALFQGWLLLSQPPGCLRTTTTFPTKRPLGALSRRSGLLPSWRRRLAPATSLVAVSLTWGIHGLVGVGNPQKGPEPTQCPTSPAGLHLRGGAHSRLPPACWQR